jgi:acetyl-CoA carboxylase carboxyltransferase component
MNPYFIKFEKPKKELYLTVSCLISKNNKKIIDIRDDILSIINNEKSNELRKTNRLWL